MNKFNDAKKEARVSKIPSNVSLKHLKEPDIDTLTYPKAVGTNNKLATALKVKDALEFGKYFTFLNAALKPEDVDVKDTKFKQLIFTNKEILSVLKRIEANQLDEQDTSIKHKDKSDSVVINNYYYGDGNSDSEESESSGFDLPDLTPGLPRRKPGRPKGSKNKNKNKNSKKPKNSKASKEPKNKNKNNKNKLKETEAKKTPKNTEKEKLADKAKNTEKAKSESAKNAEKAKTSEKVQNSEKLSPKQEKAVLDNAKNVAKKTFRPTKVAKSLARFVPGAGAAMTALSIGAGVYDYVNAECDADRQDAVANALGAAAGALAGAKLGAAIGGAAGTWFFGIGAVPGAFVGSAVGAGIGAIAGSDLGQWLSDHFKTPLDLIPDKFTNQGPEVEYVYITTKLLPVLNNACYTDEAQYEEDAKAVADRLAELEEEIKNGSTQEQRDEWSANRLKNDGIVESNWVGEDEIKDWVKVNALSDSDLNILETQYSLSDLDKDRIAEIKFKREAKTQNKNQSTVSSLDNINEALKIERQRLEDAKKDVTYDSTGVPIYNDPGAVERAQDAIEQLQKTKHTILNLKGPNAENNATDFYNLYENNKNGTKRLQSSINANTRQAELLSERGVDSKTFNNVWATNFSKHADISSDVIRDFNSIKAQDIKFNTSDHLGFVSGEFESGGNPGTIAKDNFGYAYGAWQMNSQKGILPKFVESLKGDKKFGKLAELKIDSPEFQKEWVSLAKQYPNEFLKKQHECISKNLFMPVYNYAKSAGIDVSNRAVQEALWSQAVQHGLSGNKKIIDAAASKLSQNSKPEDIVRALYSARSNYVNGLSTLDSGLKEQLNSRYRKETSKALGVASNIDYQNSAVTKNVASDNFDGSNVDIETISEEQNKAVEVEKNVSLVQNLGNNAHEPEISKPEVSENTLKTEIARQKADIETIKEEQNKTVEAEKNVSLVQDIDNAPEQEISKPEVSENTLKTEIARQKAELQTIIQLKNDGKFDEAEKRLKQLNKDREKLANTLAKARSGDSKQEILNLTPTKRDNIKIEDINANNVDNRLMMKAAENNSAKSVQQNSLNLPSMNSGQSSEKSERNSFDLTNPTIPFVS